MASKEVVGGLLVALPIALIFGSAVADVVAVCAAAAFLAHKSATGNVDWLQPTWLRVLLVLWAFAVARSAFAAHPMHSLSVSFTWVRFIVLAAATADILSEDHWRKRMFFSVAAATAFLALDSLLQASIGRDIIGRPLYEGRLTATFARPRVGITIAWIFLPAAMGLLSNGRPKLAAALVSCCLAAILLSGDRLAFLFALACIGLALLTMRLDWRWALGAVAAAASLIAVLLVLRPDVYERQVKSTASAIEKFGSTHYGVIWSRALSIAGQHPWLGLGTDEYRSACDNPRYGDIEISNNRLPACALHPHNLYLEWLVDNGAVGLSLFVLALGLIFRRLMSSTALLRRDPIFAALVITLALRFFPLSSSTGFSRSWYAIPLWLYVGWALAIAERPTLSRSASSNEGSPV